MFPENRLVLSPARIPQVSLTLHYFEDFKKVFERNFKKVGSFDNILRSHLIPKEFLEKEEFKPKDYVDFLYTRAEWLCQKLKDELPNVEVEIVN